MKAFYYICAVVIVVFGVVMGIQGDMETFRFGILFGMMCDIYAEIID